MAVRARERLLAAARELFYSEGVRAVGVERLLEASGVGRASFYRHFDSKDDLVAAMLDDYDVEYRTWLRTRVAELGGDPSTVFDAVAEHAEQSHFRGCAFLNTMAEIADPDDPLQARVAAHKSAVTDYLAELLTNAGVEASDHIAARWMMLLDGAVVTAGYMQDATPFSRAREIATRDLSAHRHPSPNSIGPAI
ncbi:TetR/AcrR family transcriptional regulator [Saccharomonospora iraqiensis]|uniref:TetR/AcrR family transcriptional regulator n=1 Tax=Saccharomonospora iraqiensis TaxID=52698 RepID=UPI00047C5BB2|nr:TetR/AcrR family transcriptional regulator [Saccharomonospora iraqiensis]